MYTVSQIMERYRVAENTVLRWLHTGQLAGVNVGREPGKKKKRGQITAEALVAFETARTQCPPPPRAPRRRKQSTPDTIEFFQT